MFSKPISLISFIAIILCSFFVVNTYAQIVWTRYEHNPILKPGGTGAWDENFAIATTVLYHDDIYKMWYEGDEDFGYATSLDGLIWTKDGVNNPVLVPDSSGFWDDSGVALPFVLQEESILKMWYGGTDGAFFQSGYATSEIATSINDIQVSLDDFKYSLEQNYPNPFNSKTTINYQLEFN